MAWSKRIQLAAWLPSLVRCIPLLLVGCLLPVQKPGRSEREKEPRRMSQTLPSKLESHEYGAMKPGISSVRASDAMWEALPDDIVARITAATEPVA